MHIQMVYRLRNEELGPKIDIPHRTVSWAEYVGIFIFKEVIMVRPTIKNMEQFVDWHFIPFIGAVVNMIALFLVSIQMGKAYKPGAMLKIELINLYGRRRDEEKPLVVYRFKCQQYLLELNL